MARELAGDGESTAQLFKMAFDTLRKLQKEMDRRRSKDKASTLLTDHFVCVEKIGRRLAAVVRGFDERPPPRREEEIEEDYEPDAQQRSMAELFPSDVTNDELELDELMTSTVDSYRESYDSIRQVRLRHFREFLDYLMEGCSQQSEVTDKLLAITRRVRPGAMAAFGISQVAVSRKLAKKRATVSAREKKLVEAPLKSNGTKGFLLLGGTKSESQRAACARVQRGNTNRRDGEAKKRVV